LGFEALKWADINSSTTVVTLKNRLMENDTTYESMDIRKALFHEVISPELTLGALTEWTVGGFTDGNLQFFGTYAEVKALAEQRASIIRERLNGAIEAKGLAHL